MQLSADAIKDFKAIYHTEYGIHLSDAEATEMARNLLSLFQVVARPLPREEQAKPCPRHCEEPSSRPTND